MKLRRMQVGTACIPCVPDVGATGESLMGRHINIDTAQCGGGTQLF